jgi:glucan phosphorylase
LNSPGAGCSTKASASPRAITSAFDHLLNPDALTIGFARRFATYKRAPLIFQQFDNIVKLVKDKQRPVQFIYAGKAHPRDDDGKRFIQQIIHLSKHSELAGIWFSSRTTTSTWPGRWFPAATSG